LATDLPRGMESLKTKLEVSLETMVLQNALAYGLDAPVLLKSTPEYESVAGL
jgi:hypothetical protein